MLDMVRNVQLLWAVPASPAFLLTTMQELTDHFSSALSTSATPAWL